MPEPLDLLQEMESTFRVVRAIVDEARAANNPKLALLAAHRLNGTAELLARLRGELHDGANVAINLHAQPEFIALQRTLDRILLPEQRAQIARALLASGQSAHDDRAR